jgi:ubiquinone/menaquinone biosynthesis C-methylase UbiE
VNNSDHFSSRSVKYALYRPTYPAELFQYLVSSCPVRELAWDCATGNGQAATCLRQYFKKVIATDISSTQISEARKDKKIDYRVASVVHSGLKAQSIDLIVVAQALHWFDIAAFYCEAERVLKKRGACRSFLSATTHQLRY